MSAPLVLGGALGAWLAAVADRLVWRRRERVAPSTETKTLLMRHRHVRTDAPDAANWRLEPAFRLVLRAAEGG